MRAILLVATLLVAGCINPSTPDTTNDPLWAGDFVTMHWECGFVPAGTICEHAWITPAREAFILRGTSTAGTGQVSFEGEHPGLNSAQAKALLADAGYDTSALDFEISGFGGSVTDEEIISLLQAAQWFDQTEAEHNNEPMLADAGWLHIAVTSNSGDGTPDTTKTSKAYNGAGDDGFEMMEEAIVKVIESVAHGQGLDY